MTNRSAASVVRGAVKACRPKQWAKNSLVFIAPVAANAFVSRGDDGGVEFHADAFWKTLLAFAVFSMVASATYLINDSVDVESDRRHPTKCKRPIAAGIITVPFAVTLAVVLTVAGLGLAAWLNLAFCLVVALYAVQTTLYSFWWKREPVLDVVALSGGFILRLLGGAYAIDVDVSTWFFIISCFGALFIAAGKRLAEKRELGGKTEGIRKTLAVYTEGYLQFLQGVAAAIVLIAYVMWAFERADAAPNAEIWFLLSILPFLIAILRYGLLVELGKGSAPEEILLTDRQMRVMGLLWVIIVGIGFYVAG